MTYTVKLDFWIDEDGVRTDEEVVEVINDIFDYSGCTASDVRIIAVND